VYIHRRALVYTVERDQEHRYLFVCFFSTFGVRRVKAAIRSLLFKTISTHGVTIPRRMTKKAAALLPDKNTALSSAN